jgi:predicted NBD/HSP70 family sugar kinase
MSTATYQLKNLNRRSVLNYIRKNKSVTKTALSAVTGLTFMAIKKIFSELENLELIRTDVLEAGGVGRKAVTYTINEHYGYTVGVHINIYRTSAAVLNLHGEILASIDLDMAGLPESQNQFISKLILMIHQIIAEAGVDIRKIIGIGVGAPGPVNAVEGIILMPPNLQLLQYLPIKQIIEERLNLPVFLQKDANAIALGEYWHSSGRDSSDLIYIDIDMGIGSGLVIGGKLHEGAAGAAGEFGHMTLDVDGPLCSCGNYGCLEAMSSGLALLRDFRDALAGQPGHPLADRRDMLNIQDLLEAAARNDVLALQLINTAACRTGAAVRNLINMLDPHLIILGGLLITGYPRYFEIVRDAARSRKIKGAQEHCILKTEQNLKAGLVGAGEIAADHFFEEVVLRGSGT